MRKNNARNLDVRLLLNTSIENIDTVYGGAIYWMFHGAGLNLQLPYLKGYFPMPDSGQKFVDYGKYSVVLIA